MTKLCRVNNALRSYRTYMGKYQLPRVESEALLEENHKWTFEIRLRSPNYLWFDEVLYENQGNLQAAYT